MRILIVGGGIAGLSLGTALRRAGFVPEIVERALGWAPIGAGIVLSVNAMAVLRRLGLAEGAESRGLALGEAVITDSRGRLLGRSDLAALRPRHGNTIAIHRADLHEVLLSGCADLPIQLGRTADALLDEGPQVQVRFSDGSRSTYDLVVGADGLRSKVRELAFGPAARSPIYSGYTCWRFVVDLPRALERTVEMWGRGQRLGLVPLPGPRVYGFAVANAPANAPDPAEGSVERLRARFASFAGAARSVLGQIDRPELLIRNDLEEVVQQPWYSGRVVLIGDAAHASTPNMGQGAAMAIEDSWVLAELLAEKRPAPETLAAFAMRRAGRVRFVQDQSRRIGRLGQWENPLACALRNLVLRAIPDSVAARALERLVEQPI